LNDQLFECIVFINVYITCYGTSYSGAQLIDSFDFILRGLDWRLVRPMASESSTTVKWRPSLLSAPWICQVWSVVYWW